MDQWWYSLTKYYGLDWVGITFSMFSTHFLAKKRKRGFLIGMIGNLAFVGFGIIAQSAANVLANSIYFVLNARGWLNWKADPPASANQPCNSNVSSPSGVQTDSGRQPARQPLTRRPSRA